MVIAHRRVTCGGNRTRLMGCFDHYFINLKHFFGEFFLTDQEMWEDAVRLAKAEYDVLSESVKDRVRRIGETIRQIKREIFSLADKSDINKTCAACGGLCCETGKYHFSVIDLLIYFSTGTELFGPSFREKPCPYLGDAGCLMEPAYRPFTCITFHCEHIESHLASGDLERIGVLERRLRDCCAELERLFGHRMTQGLLLRYARRLQGDVAEIISTDMSHWSGCAAAASKSRM